MDRAVVSHAPPAANNFRDGLGERRRHSDASGDIIELLCLRRELTAVPSFEFALRERASRLASFRHDAFARVRSIDRLNEPSAALAVASGFTRGVRLSHLLTPNGRRTVTIDITAAVHLIRQTVSAVAALHESARDIAHCAISPERIIVTANARAIIAEYVLGAALEQLRYTPERYWKELRIALPPTSSPVPAKFDHRADVTQLGIVALSLVLGRPLTDDEHPGAVEHLLASAQAISSRGGSEPLPHGLREWIGRALQLDPRDAFASASEARAALDRVSSGPTAVDAAARAVKAEPKPAAGRVLSEAPPPAPPPVASQARTSAAPAPPVATIPPPSALTPAPIAQTGPSEAKASPGRPPIGGPVPARIAAPVPATKAATAASEQPSNSEAASKPNTEPARVEPALNPVLQSGAYLSPSREAETGASAETIDFEAERPSDGVTTDAGAGSREPAAAKRLVIAAVAVAAVVAVCGYGARQFFSTPDAPVVTGTVNVASNPPGAQIFVDRQGRGATPLTLTLRPGPHTIELRGIGEPRTIDVNIVAGTQTSQYIELTKPAVPEFGQLQVRTEPSGAQLTVDGVTRGKTPLLVEALKPGVHTVVLEGDLGTVKQTVTVEAAATASLVVPMAVSSGAPLSGWITLTAPVALEIRERDKVLGTSQSERIMVTAGRHELEIVSDTLGYRATAIVQVLPGKVAPVKIEWPKGTASLNAEPWAEVWIDGEKVGDTPIGNLSLPIGPHEIVFRHPELGEQRHAVSVSLRTPARLSVDMRKQ
jgi:serine/threonine protein kinase